MDSSTVKILDRLNSLLGILLVWDDPSVDN